MKNYQTTTIALTLLLTLIGCTGQTNNNAETKNTPQSANEEQESVTQQPTKKQITAQDAIHEVKAQQREMALAQPAMLNNRVAKMQRHNVMPPQPRIIPSPRINESNSENYQKLTDNPIKLVSEDPVSTFSVDVDTGSYSNMRRMINRGRMPNQDAIRLEELINYFDYNYPTPASTEQPFSINSELAIAPWNSDRQLLKIGLKGYELPKQELGNANLVFLLDVSGSMNSPDKLPLLKQSLRMLTAQLDEHDRVSIVVYAGAAGVVLEPTAGNDKQAIDIALNKLNAGGSTNGGQGIELAYQLAQQNFIAGGVNRVLLATDGDFNVGTTNLDTLKKLIEKKRESGIGLTTLGFGQGNYNDHLMEQLADIGNGNYAYIDNINEARKVLVDQLSSTLQIIAKDVKIQIEFNPDQVAQYRLIGYENRQLKREDFNNDKVDAGDIGAGHDVTAIYELTMKDAKAPTIDKLRYQTSNESSSRSNELAQVKLRYKQPNSDKSQLITRVIKPSPLLPTMSNDFKFSAAVAAFGQLLKGGKYLENYQYQDIINMANQAKGNDNFGYRSEFIQLVRTVASLPQNHKQERDSSTN